jgi:hypothetical protein
VGAVREGGVLEWCGGGKLRAPDSGSKTRRRKITRAERSLFARLPEEGARGGWVSWYKPPDEANVRALWTARLIHKLTLAQERESWYLHSLSKSRAPRCPSINQVIVSIFNELGEKAAT